MTAMVELVGTEHGSEVIRPIVFELSSKNFEAIHAILKKMRMFPIFRLYFHPDTPKTTKEAPGTALGLYSKQPDRFGAFPGLPGTGRGAQGTRIGLPRMPVETSIPPLRTSGHHCISSNNISYPQELLPGLPGLQGLVGSSQV